MRRLTVICILVALVCLGCAPANTADSGVEPLSAENQRLRADLVAAQETISALSSDLERLQSSVAVSPPREQFDDLHLACGRLAALCDRRRLEPEDVLHLYLYSLVTGNGDVLASTLTSHLIPPGSGFGQLTPRTIHSIEMSVDTESTSDDDERSYRLSLVVAEAVDPQPLCNGSHSFFVRLARVDGIWKISNLATTR